MSRNIATSLPVLHLRFRHLFYQNGAANDMHEPSFWGNFISTCLELLAQMLGFLDMQLAMHNSMVALVELTDNCTLRHSARALYHCRSPYVPMLTALTLYHLIRDGIVWTAGGLMLALMVGNVCINVFYKMLHQSFLLLGLPLPAPAIHCEMRPEQPNVLVPPSTQPRPTPLWTASLGATPLLSSDTVHAHNTTNTRNFQRHRQRLAQLFEQQHNNYNHVLTNTSCPSDSSAASSSTHSHYEYEAVDADGYEYDDDDDDDVDDNTASTMSTAVDNVQDVFGRVLQEICEKVEVCHDQ